MRFRSRLALVAPVLLLAAAASTATAGDHGAASLEEARVLAAQTGKPILLDFATEW